MMSFSQLPAIKKTSFQVGISFHFRPLVFRQGFSISKPEIISSISKKYQLAPQKFHLGRRIRFGIAEVLKYLAMKIKLCKFFLGMSPCQKLRHASLKQYNSTGPTMAVLGNFCRKKYLIQISIEGTNELKILKNKDNFVTSILKVDIVPNHSYHF